MAFPTSPSNNQVHKEGTRSFVYDSTLGAWDQIKETDRFNKTGLLSKELNEGVIGSGVTFPSGHVVQDNLLQREAIPTDKQGHISTGSDTFVNTGIAGSFTTVASANDSYLVFDFFSGMTHIGAINSWGATALALKASDSTSWSERDDITAQASSTFIYRNRFGVGPQGTGMYIPYSIRYVYHKPERKYPTDLPSYTAGQTLYARLFICEPSGSTFYVVHSSTYYTFRFQEIML